MKPEDELGVCEVEFVVAAIDIYAPRVQHRPHSAVEDVDSVLSDDVSKVSHLGPVSGEHRRVAFPEEVGVKQSYSPYDLLIIYDEGQVYDGGALADHIDVDIAKSPKQPCRYPRREFEVVAHHADNGFRRVDADFTYSAQFVEYGLEAVGIIERHRHRSLGSSNDVDRGLVPVEHLEYRPQE